MSFNFSGFRPPLLTPDTLYMVHTDALHCGEMRD